MYKFNSADWDGLRNNIKNKQEQFFQARPLEQSVNTNWLSLKNIIHSAIEENIPSKLSSFKHNIPWLTTDIKRLIRKRNKLHARAKKSKKDQDWAKFRNLRKCIQTLLAKSHDKFVNDMYYHLYPMKILNCYPNEKRTTKVCGLLSQAKVKTLLEFLL